MYFPEVKKKIIISKKSIYLSMLVFVILEEGLCFMQVWGDEKEVIHQSHQTPARDTKIKKDCSLLLHMRYCIYRR